MKPIPIAGPSISQLEIDYVNDAVTTCWYDQANRYVNAFEESFAKFVGTKYAVSLPSCTSALHLSLEAFNVGPGDEVVLPDLTWIASAAPIQYVGATPVFADVDPSTWCLSAATIERCLTPKTKAIIAVDLYGTIPAMDEIRALADAHGLPVIEDAAEAFGSSLHGRQAGSFGDVGTFSFHGSKTMTTGEGGMLVTDLEDVYRRIMFLRDHGRTPGDTSFRNQEVAFKYKMSSMQAALGLAQLERADELVAKKRQIFHWYQRRLAANQAITLNPARSGERSSYWMTTAVFDASTELDTKQVQTRLADEQIQTRPFFPPLSSIPAFHGTNQARTARERNIHAYDISPRGVNLPSALSVTEQDVNRVCESVLRLVAGDCRSDRSAAA